MERGRWISSWVPQSRTASPSACKQGRNVLTPQTLAACDEAFDDGLGKAAGFSLRSRVAAEARERKKLERLCCYISRPAVSEKRLSLTPNGNVRYQLKTPYRDGTTSVIFEPLDFIARLAALVCSSAALTSSVFTVCLPSIGNTVRR